MKKHIGIQTPCSEDRANMKPTAAGSYCGKCAMDVLDFSKMSNQEIKELLLKKSDERICARMSPRQEQELNTEFQEWKWGRKEHMQKAMVFSLFLIFGLSLFSCSDLSENDALERAHQEIKQSIEVNYLTDSDNFLINDTINNDVVPELEVEQKVEQEIKPIVCEILPVTEYEIQVDGGIGYSHEYLEYLEEEVHLIEPEEPLESIIKEHEMEFEAIVFPNPATNSTTLRIEIPEEINWMHLKLVDIHGKTIQLEKKTHLLPGPFEYTFNVESLNPGAYIVVLETESYQKTIRLIKQ